MVSNERVESLLKDTKDLIVFDENSGISIEEQKEIVAELDAMSGGGLGSRIVPNSPVENAKKKGFIFPLIINISAIALLTAGFLILSGIHNQDVELIRRNAAISGQTEQMMIEEIRLEVNLRIREIENQMNALLLRISEADSEMQAEYRQTLQMLEEERARLFEELLIAEELRGLGSEQEQINRIEDQMSGFYAAFNNQIANGLFNETFITINAMREFLAAPSLQQLHAFEIRRLSHLAIIDAMEEVIGFLLEDPQTGRNMAQEEHLSELIARNNALESELLSLSAQGSESLLAINRLQVEREQEIAELNNTLAASNIQNAELQRQNTELQNQIEAIRTLLAE